MSEDNKLLVILKGILQSNNFQILNIFTRDDNIKYILITSDTTGDNIMLYIPKKYVYSYNDGIKLSKIDNNDICEVNTTNYNSFDYYKPIIINELQNDIIDKDIKYPQINLETEKINNMKIEISNNFKQLHRLKNCVTNIKYKLSLLTCNTLLVINKKNTIDSFHYTNSNTEESKKDLVITISLDMFYNNISDITYNVDKIQKKLFGILSNVYTQQTQIVSSYVKQYSKVHETLSIKYEKRKKYMSTIDLLNDNIKKLKEEEKDLKSFIRNNDKTLININADINRSMNVRKTELRLNTINTLKDDAIRLLKKMKREYNNFVFDFDNVLFDNIYYFDCVNKNFINIGVLSKC